LFETALEPLLIHVGSLIHYPFPVFTVLIHCPTCLPRCLKRQFSTGLIRIDIVGWGWTLQPHCQTGPKSIAVSPSTSTASFSIPSCLFACPYSARDPWACLGLHPTPAPLLDNAQLPLSPIPAPCWLSFLFSCCLESTRPYALIACKSPPLQI
jgi:hypothetical protein